MPTDKLTKKLIDTHVPTTDRETLWDSSLPGFGVRFSPTGKKTFVIKYRSGHGRNAKQRWFTIGLYGALTLEQARLIAKKRFGEIANDLDPQFSRELTERPKSLNDVWKMYLETDAMLVKAATRANYQNAWDQRIAHELGSIPISDLNLSRIERAHRLWRDKPHSANRALALISLLLNFAEKRGLRPIGQNPCRLVKKYKEENRERFLSADELRRLSMALNEVETTHLETPFVTGAIRLLLYTGARSGEILNSRWEYVDWDNALLNLPDSKTGRKPVILGDSALIELRKLRTLNSILPSPFIIQGQKPSAPVSSLKKPWARICDRAKLANFRIHDLRHTAASLAAGAGLSLHQIGKLLGHTQSSTTQRYAHLAVNDARTSANLLGQKLDEAFKPAGSDSATDAM